MSDITSKQVRGMLEAYAAVHNEELRTELEEEQREIEELGLQMIENAAYVLFSQGYDVDDLISYFEEAKTDIIVEDFVSFAEGQTYLSESFIVSDEYIAEQFELLNERVPGLGWLASQAGRAANAVKGAVAGVKKSAETYNRAKNIQNIRNAKNTVPPGSAKVTTSGTTPGPRIPGTGPKITTSGGKPATPNMLQKAGNWAKTQLGKLPGAQTAQKFAKSGAGKFLGKVGSRALPGLGVATYGMDAAKRFKKGDWGGGLLSTAGAVTSAIPGAGLVAGLAPAAIQAATDAAGLTGDKSRKGGAKPTPAGPPSLKAKQDYAKSKGKYYSSSDQKTYANYNDALAARNSRRGAKPPSPAAPAAPAAPSGGGGKPPAPPKPAGSEKPKPEGSKLTPMQQWAKANPKLADKVKVGQSGYDDISAMRTKPGPNEKQDQTPTTGPKTTPEQDKNLAQQAMSDVQAQQEREKKKLEQQKNATASTTKESYEMLADYFMITGQADSIAEAYYIISCMNEEDLREELTGARKERAQEIMGELRPHGRPRKATNKKYGALSRVTRASEGSSEPGRTTETSPKKRGGRMPKGSVKTGWDGDFQADRPKG